MQQKIVLIGGPGAGKTSVLNELKKRGYFCMEEISRTVTLQAQEEGINQLFLTNPLLFSKTIFTGRVQQFITAEKSGEKIVFFDRGIPDVYAYMDYLNTEYPTDFIKKSKQYTYTKAFLFPPWEKIYTSDNERYEVFEEAIKISSYLQKTYQKLGYTLVVVPFSTVIERTNFIVNSLSI